MKLIKDFDEKGDYYKSSHDCRYYYSNPVEREIALERCVGGELIGGIMKDLKKQKEIKPKKKQNRLKKTRVQLHKSPSKSSLGT
jgi:hypothetical protein